LLTPDGTIAITPLLGTALRHIRQKEAVLVLRVDAICINQKDKWLVDFYDVYSAMGIIDREA